MVVLVQQKQTLFEEDHTVFLVRCVGFVLEWTLGGYQTLQYIRDALERKSTPSVLCEPSVGDQSGGSCKVTTKIRSVQCCQCCAEKRPFKFGDSIQMKLSI